MPKMGTTAWYNSVKTFVSVNIVGTLESSSDSEIHATCTQTILSGRSIYLVAVINISVFILANAWI